MGHVLESHCMLVADVPPMLTQASTPKPHAVPRGATGGAGDGRSWEEHHQEGQQGSGRRVRAPLPNRLAAALRGAPQFIFLSWRHQVAMMDCKLLAARHSTFEATERSKASRSSFTILRA